MLLVVAGLVVFAGQRAAFHGRSVTESFAKAPPAPEAGLGFDAVDEDRETRRLGVLSVRASVFLTISIVVAVAGFVFMVTAGDEIGESPRRAGDGLRSDRSRARGDDVELLVGPSSVGSGRRVARGDRDREAGLRPGAPGAGPATFDVRFLDGETKWSVGRTGHGHPVPGRIVGSPLRGTGAPVLMTCTLAEGSRLPWSDMELVDLGNAPAPG